MASGPEPVMAPVNPVGFHVSPPSVLLYTPSLVPRPPHRAYMTEALVGSNAIALRLAPISVIRPVKVAPPSGLLTKSPCIVPMKSVESTGLIHNELTAAAAVPCHVAPRSMLLKSPPALTAYTVEG